MFLCFWFSFIRCCWAQQKTYLTVIGLICCWTNKKFMSGKSWTKIWTILGRSCHVQKYRTIWFWGGGVYINQEDNLWSWVHMLNFVFILQLDLTLMINYLIWWCNPTGKRLLQLLNLCYGKSTRMLRPRSRMCSTTTPGSKAPDFCMNRSLF